MVIVEDARHLYQTQDSSCESKRHNIKRSQRFPSESQTTKNHNTTAHITTLKMQTRGM